MEGLGISAGKRWPKWKTKLRSPFITVLRVFLGSVLFSAGVAKMANFPLFLRYISLYDLLPPSLVTPTGYLLLSAEISIGALLIIGYFSRGAALLGGILFLTFSMALSSVIWRGLPLEDCGCENVLFKLFGARLDWKAVSGLSPARLYAFSEEFPLQFSKPPNIIFANIPISVPEKSHIRFIAVPSLGNETEHTAP